MVAAVAVGARVAVGVFFVPEQGWDNCEVVWGDRVTCGVGVLRKVKPLFVQYALVVSFDPVVYVKQAGRVGNEACECKVFIFARVARVDDCC